VEDALAPLVIQVVILVLIRAVIWGVASVYGSCLGQRCNGSEVETVMKGAERAVQLVVKLARGITATANAISGKDWWLKITAWAWCDGWAVQRIYLPI